MSVRSAVISRLLKNRDSREAYIGAKLKVLIPSQIRGLRLKSRTPRQEDLAKAAEMKQSRISAMETPGAVNFNLETLVRIAAALRVALVVKFVPFSELVSWENEFSQDEFSPATIENDTEFIGETVLGSAALSGIEQSFTHRTHELDLGSLQPMVTGAASGLI